MSAKPLTHFDAELTRITGRAIADSLDIITTALSERYAVGLGVERAWLIEWPQTPDSQARWWHPERGWTIDASRAQRFARKEDAEASINSRPGLSGVATEHEWLQPLETSTGAS